MDEGTPVRPFHLVVVEDSPDHAELIFRSVQRADPTAELVHLADGAEALDHMARATEAGAPARPPWPDLVLLDLSIPKVHGLAVLRELKGAPATRALPIVVLSSSDAPQDVRAAYEAGANGYLVKPMSFSDLRAQMAAVMAYWRDHNLGARPAHESPAGK